MRLDTDKIKAILKQIADTDKPYLELSNIFEKDKHPESDENENYIWIEINARAYLTHARHQLLDSLASNTWMHSVKNVLGEMGADIIKKLPFSLISSVIKTSLS